MFSRNAPTTKASGASKPSSTTGKPAISGGKPAAGKPAQRTAPSPAVKKK